MAFTYSRGHKMYYNSNTWLYCDTNKPEDEMRPCARCGKPPTPEGYDACIGHVEGAISVCCGHGKSPPILSMSRKYHAQGIIGTRKEYTKDAQQQMRLPL